MATNDDIRLKMTVSKMNIHRSTKLETIAAKCIVRNLDSFLDPQYSETRNVKLLPVALRNIVLQQWLMRQLTELKISKYQDRSKYGSIKLFEKRMKVFQSLVSCHTLEVDFTPFMGEISIFFGRELLLRYLKFFETKATNLKILTVKDCNLTNGAELNVKLCNAIGKLRNLRSLNIGNIQIKYTNLKAMCKNLESLTHLYTSINFHLNFDVFNQREIEDLQIFSNLIAFDHGCSFEENLTINCIQHLPRLQCFGSKITAYIIEELLDRCPTQKFALTEMTFKESSNKEIHLSFPYVTNLKVIFPRGDYDNVFTNINSLLKFSKIENLTLTDFPSINKFIPFLDTYGHALHSLRIINVSGQLKLSPVLDRCPKLHSLFLNLDSMLPECSRPEIHSFSTGLKELDLKFPRFIDDDHAPLPLLLDILLVPTLECVALRMGVERFHLEDIERLTAMITSRQILGNLKRLKLMVYDTDWENNYRVFLALSNFIKTASAFLPHLTEIKTNILSNVLVRNNPEASLEVATLKQVIKVHESF